MKKPIIFAVDDDEQVLSAIRQDLRAHFKKNYRIISTTEAQEALDSLKDLRNKGEEVALFLSDQRMPQMNGTQFLEQAKTFYPNARRVLLTAYSDTDAAISAINLVQLDYYLLKPWDPPEEKLYPVLEDLLDQWQAEFVPPFSGLRVVGYPFSAQSHALKDYLAGNLFPYRWLDFENSKDAQKLISDNNLVAKDLPVLFFEDGQYLCQPTVKQVAEKLGLNPKAQADLYDVVIIGAGPAGLAASVYGASEGLKTLLIEKHAPGGQAGTSSRIENYLGFPKGLSGSELTRRAITQSARLGAEFLSPAEVAEIKIKDQNKIVALADGSEILTRSVVITTGVDYRKLNTKGLDQLTGAGVYYGAATTEANACKNKPASEHGEWIKEQTGLSAISRVEHEEENDEIYRQKGICSQLWKAPQINSDGRVLGCCVNTWGAYGTYTEGKLSSVFNNEKMIRARDMLMGKAEARKDIPCTQCSVYKKMVKREDWITKKDLD
jgi:thioredoxin reductase (NADPH)